MYVEKKAPFNPQNHHAFQNRMPFMPPNPAGVNLAAPPPQAPQQHTPTQQQQQQQPPTNPQQQMQQGQNRLAPQMQPPQPNQQQQQPPQQQQQQQQPPPQQQSQNPPPNSYHSHPQTAQQQPQGNLPPVPQPIAVVAQSYGFNTDSNQAFYIAQTGQARNTLLQHQTQANNQAPPHQVPPHHPYQQAYYPPTFSGPPQGFISYDPNQTMVQQFAIYPNQILYANQWGTSRK